MRCWVGPFPFRISLTALPLLPGKILQGKWIFEEYYGARARPDKKATIVFTEPEKGGEALTQEQQEALIEEEKTRVERLGLRPPKTVSAYGQDDCLCCSPKREWRLWNHTEVATMSGHE